MRADVRGSATACSVKGTKHHLNEDRYRMLSRDIPLVFQHRRGELFGVFDGIGSAPRGREAAQSMADCLVEFYRQPQVYAPSHEGVWALLMAANLTIHDWGFMAGGGKRPLGGAAGTVVWLFGESLYIFQAGDTAAFLFRDRKTIALTQAHQLEDGAIYRYFGMGPSLRPDISSYAIEEGDWILLVSDGVTKVCHTNEITSIMADHTVIDRVVTELVKKAIKKGSTDDITVLLVEVEEIWDKNNGDK